MAGATGIHGAPPPPPPPPPEWFPGVWFLAEVKVQTRKVLTPRERVGEDADRDANVGRAIAPVPFRPGDEDGVVAGCAGVACGVAGGVLWSITIKAERVAHTRMKMNSRKLVRENPEMNMRFQRRRFQCSRYTTLPRNRLNTE